MYDQLAEAIGTVDDDEVTETRLGVEGESDAAGGKIGAHHLLHADGETHVKNVEVESLPVADRPVGEEGGEAVADGIDERGRSAYVEIGFLLAGEAGVGQVFGGGGRADGNVGGRLSIGLG